MSGLLKKIKAMDSKAARAFEQAGLTSDFDIQSLTREDLNQLLPGLEQFKLRKAIFEEVQNRRPVDVVLRELTTFFPYESVRADLTSSGVLVEYLLILKDMKTQMDHIQSFLNAHISLVENLSKNQPAQEPDKGATSHTSTSGTVELSNAQPRGSDDFGGQMVTHTGPADGHPKGYQRTDARGGQTVTYTASHRGFSPRHSLKRSLQDRQVKYQKVVSGKTFQADEQLMKKVSEVQDQFGVEFIESTEDGQIIIVFCPICSRIGSDVEAAMTSVTGDRPVILVLMHHTREVKCTTSARPWQNYQQVVLPVNVFYHETVHGLLSCAENDCAAIEIRNMLLDCSPSIKDTSGNAPDAGGGSGRTGGSANGNNSGGFFPKFWFQGK